MLNNRLEEDEILGINHDGSLQSRIVGQPPMFELILSKEPKLTLEVTVLKAHVEEAPTKKGRSRGSGETKAKRPGPSIWKMCGMAHSL